MRLKRLVSSLPSVAALAVIVLTASLGQWQLGRAQEKAAAAQAREAALARAPIAMTPQAQVTELDGARLSLQGRWAGEHTIFLDNRTRQGVAGFHVITPLRLEGPEGMHVLVLRGWIARDVADRTRLPQIPTSEGMIRLEGLGMATLPQPIVLSRTTEVDPATPRIWQHLQTQAYATWSGLSVHPLIVRQWSESEDTLMRDWTPPGRGEDKHRAYAFQWFAMSSVTGIIWLMLSLRRRRRLSP
jgi:surfeit locus 1 family protein